jgi:hypothetical protein
MTSGRRITTHEATVSTASITVKTLTLDKRQVTLAVFRQLLREPLIDPQTGTLRGVPWGIVNYHPDHCHAAPEHVHVVFLVGDELRRAWVPREHPAREERLRVLSYMNHKDAPEWLRNLRNAGPHYGYATSEQIRQAMPRSPQDETWDEQYAAIGCLDQLFIAV